jgi:hypothetical protein
MLKDTRNNTWTFRKCIKRYAQSEQNGGSITLNGHFGYYETNFNQVIKIQNKTSGQIFREIHFYLNVCKENLSKFNF